MSSFSLTLTICALFVLLLGMGSMVVSRVRAPSAIRETEPLAAPRVGEIFWTLTFAVGLVAALITHLGN